MKIAKLIRLLFGPTFIIQLFFWFYTITLIPHASAKHNYWKGRLTVAVTGIKNTQGNIKISVQKNPKLFGSKSGIESGRNRVIEIVNDKAIYTFNNLLYGEYAIAVFHDQNKNDRLDLDLFDSPVEGYGFSNNPNVKKRAPLFKESSFKFSKDKIVKVKLIYPLEYQ